MIVRRKSATELLEVATGKGLKLMREDGWAKVRKGITTVDEIIRVTKVDATALSK
jgi:type II secretory ATPase GspE/PulE/Tfp pilus assembly ATPase PilB-like protein